MTAAQLQLAGKSLLIFDDGLASKDGHWFEIDKAIVRLHRQLGVSTTVVCQAGFPHADELEAEGARVLPLIEHSLWTGRMHGTGLRHELAMMWKLARHFRRILASVLREQAYDCVIHPSAMAADMLAWVMLGPRLRRRAGRIALLTRFGLGSYRSSGPPVFARKLAYWRWMARLLGRDVAAGRFRLLTDSRRLAQEYETVTGVRPDVVPSPKVMDTPARSGRDSGPIVFGTLGAARIDKGIDVFQRAIERVLERDEAHDLRFVLQWNRAVPAPEGGELARSQVLEASGKVEFITRVLDSEEYQEAFLEIDCMVLPYRRSLYHSQISGVAFEAAYAGIPMIYTSDTWLSDFVEEFGAGVAVLDGDSEALATAILTVAREFPQFREQARHRSDQARTLNSPERFAQILWHSSAMAAS